MELGRREPNGARRSVIQKVHIAVAMSVWAFRVSVVVDWRAEEARSAMEWAQVRALAADGVTKSEIARRLEDESADGRPPR